MSSLREQIAKLTPDQLAHLQTRLESASAGSSGGSIPRRKSKGPCALSFAQERLWFLDQFDPGSPVYNISRALHIEGPLDRSALQKALDGIVSRHESLRTVFRSVDGTPVQEVIPDRRLNLQVVTLNANQASEEKVRLMLRGEVRRPFDLLGDLPLRATLFRCREEEHWLLLVLHHIASDGWSMGVLLRELSELYKGNCNGESADLPKLPIQYADFAIWQREWLRGEALEKQAFFWKERLSGAPALLELPTDYPRPNQQTLSGAREAVRFSSALTDSLRIFSRREGATLFMTLLAALQALLQRITGQTDISVGTAIANRTRVELEPMIGFFVNTLVLRNDLSGKPSFRKLLRQVREVALKAYAHPDLPFEHLVDTLQPERNLSYTPLFQVMLNLQNTPARNLQIAGATTREVKIDNGTAKFDLTLSLEDSGPQLTGWMEYNTDLFEAGTIRRMLVHYQTFLQAAIQNPDQSISTLPLLPEGERRRVLVEWNETKRDYPQACAHELFEAQVERKPEAVALVWGEQQLSYGELNRRANQLAHELRSKGVGPEALVGICVERSPDLLVALLGVLKAGGAYVPLDPAFPRERLLFMLRDAGVQVLLTQENLRAKLSESTARFICLDSGWTAISKQPSENCRSGVGPENLAYVIYTSGSTGLPKGVEVLHRALSNFLASMQVKPGLTEQDTLLAVTTASFDIAALELYLPLTVGARVNLVSRDTATDGQRLRDSLVASGATCMQATPTTWRLLVNAGWEGNPDLKILCGGEALPRELANELVGRASSVWNMYGPTETTVWSAVHQVTSATGPVFVGCPIANTELYVLDSELQPVPIGVPGELYIGGDGLARGYRNRPELTAERFVPHPFSRQADARLYNTGDLARYRADGNLELLGRRDHQVKIRGFRVELGEIEAALGEHPAVQATAVVVREEAPGEQRLVAYAVLQSGSLARAEELRSFLKGKLPDYMLPARFEFLASLPVSPSGKVDRRALPAPGSERLESEASYLAPRTEQEKKLAAIWAEVLQLDRVSIHDNFFDLGGHSLLAVKLVARVENALGKRLPVISVFQLPTISELAPLLVTPGSPEKVPGMVPIQPTGSKPPFFCVGAGPIFRPLALRLGSDQPFLGLTTVKSDMRDLPAPFKLEDIAAGLVRKLRSLQPHGPYFLGGWCQDGVFAYEMAQQLLAQGEKVGLLVLIEAWNPARLKKYSGLERSGIRLRRPFRKVAFHLANLRRHGIRETLADYKWRLQFRNFRHKLWYGYYRFLLAAQGQIDDRFRKFFRAGYFTVRDYVPKPYPERTLLIRSGFDPQRVNEPEMGWSGLLVGKSEFQFVTGGHKRIFLEPNVGLLASTLKHCLLEAEDTGNENDLTRVNAMQEVK
ncbi:MAG: amino acid adenylation domain-containing protein [Terriglobales bacterium]